MEYIIIHSTSIEEFQKDVNCHISEGWVPQGGVTALSEINDIDFMEIGEDYQSGSVSSLKILYQAMVK